MALLLDCPPCVGAYYCLMRTRFKRRRKKRSERKASGRNAGERQRNTHVSFNLILSNTHCEILPHSFRHLSR
ncbi:double-stranded RNA-specific editase 1 isoform X1 [Tachysurus ichikawai]